MSGLGGLSELLAVKQVHFSAKSPPFHSYQPSPDQITYRLYPDARSSYVGAVWQHWKHGGSRVNICIGVPWAPARALPGP